MIVNLTQHKATQDQIKAGVVDLSGRALEALTKALTFDALPTQDETLRRAAFIAHLVSGDSKVADGLRADSAMIGGAPYLMGPLEAALREVGVRALYAFSRRESVEQTLPDGAVRKVNVFVHEGFVG
jgi:hypothetical protein